MQQQGTQRYLERRNRKVENIEEKENVLGRDRMSAASPARIQSQMLVGTGFRPEASQRNID